MEVGPKLLKHRVRVWMLYQAYQIVKYGTAVCTRTRTRARSLVFHQGRTRYQRILPRAYRTYQSVGYGYGCCTEFTKGSGMGMDVLPSLPKGRVRYVCLYPCPYPIPGISTRPYPVLGYFPAGVPNLRKWRVRVLKSYQISSHSYYPHL